MSDLIEVSYTGDLLAHRRCARAWAYEKHVGLRPYEQVQAMEGHLIHHAMEWLTKKHRETGKHAEYDELLSQLEQYFRVLWAKGIRTTFASKQDTIIRVAEHLYPGPDHQPLPEVQAVIEGALHEEYPLRSVRKVIPSRYGGKKRVLLTGVLDVVVQQRASFTYHQTWRWDDKQALVGDREDTETVAAKGDIEIWDYKGVRSTTSYIEDYVRQVVTYAALLEDRIAIPARCVLFFTNEPDARKRLLAIPIDEEVVKASIEWTLDQVRELRGTVLKMQNDPLSVEGGDLRHRHEKSLANRVTSELKQQCTACGQRFDCQAYKAKLVQDRRTGHGVHPDVDIRNVRKN
jgi:hypothetical protein